MTDDGSEGVPPNKFAPEPVESEIGDIPDREYAPFYFPPEGASLLFSFTETIFQKVISSLRNGAMMTYGTDGPAVYWEFLKQVDYPVVICEAIIDCIENDEDVQHAIGHLLRHNDYVMDQLAQFMQEHPGGIEQQKLTPLPPEITAGNISIPNPDCNPDILWAQCVGIVQIANRMVEDFLQTWETYTNQGEVISDIVNSIPLVAGVADVSGISGIIEYANDLVDAIGENYLADYTLDYENELACEIFCRCKDDCVISIDILTSIMNTRISNALTGANGIELMLSLMDQDISGFNVADLYLAAFFDMLSVANLILPITWGIEKYLEVLDTFNTGSDDWMVLCTDCPPTPAGCFEFAAGLQSWTTYDDSGGQWEDGLGIGQNLNTYLTILAPLGSIEEVASLQVNFYRAWGGANDFDKFFIQIANSDLTNAQTFGGSALLYGGTDFTFTSTGDPWIRPRVQIAAGGLTWPPNGSNPTPQYVTEICFNPE